MEDLRPSIFSNIPHHLVGRKRTDSLFLIKVQVSSEDSKTQVKEYLPRTFGLRKKNLKGKFDIHTPMVATGFTAIESENSLYILTCAHLFEDFYSDNVEADSVTLEGWFDILVVCQHFESHMIVNYPNLYKEPDTDPRLYAPASIVRLEERKDLMLLQVKKNLLYGTPTLLCGSPHPALHLARVLPRPTDDIMLVSWPATRKDSAVIGQVVGGDREYGQVTQDLSKGYNMHLVELNVAGGEGTSGGPVLNHRANVVGLYHARLGATGYAVSAADIYEFCHHAVLAEEV
ncbi:uncharacterized protein LOC102699508 [Oryza brachyantha]|nr:uncharacterized protein LOC102699508 [Oryza brachyantha]